VAFAPVPQQGWSLPPHIEQRPAVQVPPFMAMVGELVLTHGWFGGVQVPE
jgi:hypothetical protein